MLQRIEIVGILIAARDRQHAGAQNIVEIMDDGALVAPVGNATGKGGGQSHPSLGLRQEQDATVRGEPPAFERRRHLLVANCWRREARRAII